MLCHHEQLFFGRAWSKFQLQWYYCTQEKEYVPLGSASSITYSDTVFLDETLNGALLFDCSALISSEIAGLYLRYVIVISKQDNLALYIFPVDEYILSCVTAEFPSEEH